MPTGRPNLGQLPLPILFRIVSLTLDPRATPSRWMSDEEEEKVRRVSGLFWGLRGVSRSFWLGESDVWTTKWERCYQNDTLISQWPLPSFDRDIILNTSNSSNAATRRMLIRLLPILRYLAQSICLETLNPHLVAATPSHRALACRCTMGDLARRRFWTGSSLLKSGTS